MPANERNGKQDWGSLRKCAAAAWRLSEGIRSPRVGQEGCWVRARSGQEGSRGVRALLLVDWSCVFIGATVRHYLSPER